MKTWDELQWRTFIWHHHRFVEKVDGEIGLILTALEQSGLADNTVIIFSVDHGEAFGQHQMFQKFSLYEASIRVPFIVSSLGHNLNIPKGAFDHKHFVSGVDLLPTVCDYAGIDPPEQCTGNERTPPSLRDRMCPGATLPLSKATTGDAHCSLTVINTFVSIFPTAMKKTCSHPAPDPERIGLEQIFDLQNDPGETQNLAFDENKRALLMQCREALLNFEAGLERRQITHERPVRQIGAWGNADSGALGRTPQIGSHEDSTVGAPPQIQTERTSHHERHTRLYITRTAPHISKHT